MAAPATSDSELKLIRSSIQLASASISNMYSSVCEYNSSVKNVLERISNSTEWIVKPAVEKVSKLSDPIVDSLDKHISDVKGRYVDTTIQKAHILKDGLTTEFSKKYNGLVDASDSYVEFYLPLEEEAEDSSLETSKSIRNVSLKAQKRAVKKLNSLLENSKSSMYELVHFDIVKVSKDRASQGYNFSKEHLTHSVDYLKESISSIQKSTQHMIDTSKKSTIENLSSLFLHMSNSLSKLGLDDVAEKSKELSVKEVRELLLVKFQLKRSTDDVAVTEQKVHELVSVFAAVLLTIFGAKRQPTSE